MGISKMTKKNALAPPALLGDSKAKAYRRAKAAKKYKATTNSNHSLPVAPNLLEQNFEAAVPDQKRVSDIASIWTEEGGVYLAVVLELYSRRVMDGAGMLYS